MMASEKLFKEGSRKEPGLEDDLFEVLPPGLQDWVRLVYQSSLNRDEALHKWKTVYHRSRPDFDRAAIYVEGYLQGFYTGRRAVYEEWGRRRKERHPDLQIPAAVKIPNKRLVDKQR